MTGTRNDQQRRTTPGRHAAPAVRIPLCHRGRLSMTQSLRLAELLASRLCHDLSGPINTLDGVLELARDDPLMQAEALGEASEAAAVLTRRLRVLRPAWGGAGERMAGQGLAGVGG